jgi:hypothetical protein
MPLSEAEKWRRGLYHIRMVITPGDEYYKLLKMLSDQDWKTVVKVYDQSEPLSTVVDLGIPIQRFMPQMDALYTWYTAPKQDNMLVIRGTTVIARNLLWMVPNVLYSTMPEARRMKKEYVRDTIKDTVERIDRLEVTE